MPVEHKVRQGEDVASIAAKYGFVADTIWNDAANKNLKEKRKDPNILQPGDKLSIPDVRPKDESSATEQRHKFRKKGAVAKLRMQLFDDDQPRKNQKYTLEVDGHFIEGTTDGDGVLDTPIPPNAKRGQLFFEGEDAMELKFATLDPVDTIRGVQARLENLGYDCKGETGKTGPKTESALKALQEAHDLKVSGAPDQATQDKLVEVHGS